MTLSVSVVFFVFLARDVALSDWSSASQLEEVIFVTQILRVVAVFSLQRLPKFNPVYAMILFSLEVFLIPCFGLLEYFTGNEFYTLVMGQVLTTWIGVSALVLTPFAIYQFFVTLAKGSPLLNIILFGTLEIGGLTLISEILAYVHTKITGPAALGNIIVQGSGFQSPVGFTGVGANLTLEAGLTLFYISMIIYIISTGDKLRPASSTTYPLLILLFGSIALFVWTGTLLKLTSNILLVFTAPSLVVATSLWVSSRGK